VLCQVPVEVASFLLNEKRTEIAKIELKQRINVLMVPNKSLETSNYKLERLKHDDPRLDNITASYKMAEEVEDVTAVTRRSQEPTNRQTPIIKGVLPDAPAPVAPPKAEPAAVAAKAVTPPAPAVAETGFFGWIKGLFAGQPAATPAPATPAATTPSKEDKRDRPDGRGGRDGARRGEPRGDGRGGDRGPRGDGRSPRGEGRGGNRGGNRGERTERGPRERSDAQANPGMDANAGAPMEAGTGLPADASRNESRGERPSRNGERGNRPERGERRPSRNQAAGNSNGPAQETGEPTTLMDDGAPMGNDQAMGNPQDEGASRDKRSRDRYGRERKPRSERTESVAPQADAFAEASGQEEDAPRKSYFRQNSDALDAGNPEAGMADTGSAPCSDVGNAPAQQPQPVNAVASATAPSTTPAVAAAYAISAPERVAPAPAPVAAAPAATAPAALAPAAASMPAVASYALPIDQLVGIAQGSGLTWVNSNAEKIAAVQAAIAAEPKPVHVPRERPPVIALDDRPLVLVETRLDLRDISLPFEETQPG
jgi:ribonuclease E